MSAMCRYCEKVFLGRRTKILRAAHAFCARRREGPYRFIQNRSRTSVVALKSGAAALEVQRSIFARFLGLFDFRLLQQYLPSTEVHVRKPRHPAFAPSP